MKPKETRSTNHVNRHKKLFPDRFIDMDKRTTRLLYEEIECKVYINDNNCWIWRGQKNKNGYGIVYNSGKKVSAHRLSYMIAHNTMITPEQYVCHACDSKDCVNPSHLYLGDAKSNGHDYKMSNIGRVDLLHMPKEKALAIRAQYNKTKDPIAVAESHDMSAADVKLVIDYEGWPWMT